MAELNGIISGGSVLTRKEKIEGALRIVRSAAFISATPGNQKNELPLSAAVSLILSTQFLRKKTFDNKNNL